MIKVLKIFYMDKSYPLCAIDLDVSKCFFRPQEKDEEFFHQEYHITVL